MKFRRSLPCIIAIFVIITLAGCGGGGTPSGGITLINLHSDPGDYVGDGKNYSYNKANAQIKVNASGGLLMIDIEGDEWWSGSFQISNTQLQPGSYTGYLNWHGEGRGTGNPTGHFTINNVTYVNGSLTAINLSFEQHDGSAVPALHGQINWNAYDATKPPGPVYPPPAGLWNPSSDLTPSSGNYIYLQIDPEYPGGETQTFTYTPSNAQINVYTFTSSNVSGSFLYVDIDDGTKDWTGYFQTMYTIIQFQPGYYGNLKQYPFASNPAQGGLSWSGSWVFDNITGWFVVDNVTYDNGVLKTIELRFELYSESSSTRVHGKIHWSN